MGDPNTVTALLINAAHDIVEQRRVEVRQPGGVPAALERDDGEYTLDIPESELAQLLNGNDRLFVYRS